MKLTLIEGRFDGPIIDFGFNAYSDFADRGPWYWTDDKGRLVQDSEVLGSLSTSRVFNEAALEVLEAYTGISALDDDDFLQAPACMQGPDVEILGSHEVFISGPNIAIRVTFPAPNEQSEPLQYYAIFSDLVTELLETLEDPLNPSSTKDELRRISDALREGSERICSAIDKL